MKTAKAPRRLVYWVAVHEESCYSIRMHTKRQCEAMRQENGANYYAPPEKMIVQYWDGVFGLLELLLGECPPIETDTIIQHCDECDKQFLMGEDEELAYRHALDAAHRDDENEPVLRCGECT